MLTGPKKSKRKNNQLPKLVGVISSNAALVSGLLVTTILPESPRLLPALDCHELYDESANCSGNRRNKLPDQGDGKREEVHILPLKRSFVLTHYTWTRKTPLCNEGLPPWQDQSSISRIRSVVAVCLIIPRAFSPQTWRNMWSIITHHSCLLVQIMPSSNLLSFFRPL